ncbi:MAG: hypothetical protein ACE5LG_08875 [Anaerolineae bacterium]
MSTKMIIILGLKVIALTIILFLCFMVASIVSGVSTLPAGAEPPPVDAGSTVLSLLVVSLLETTVLTYIILRSRWTGWKLVGAVFVAFYGLNTVVAQIESVVYLPHQLPPGMIPKLFVMGAIMAGLFSPPAVLILGKMRRELTPQTPNLRLVMPPGEWAWKLAAIAAAYLILYYTFGYFIAWKNPTVQAYYGGTDPGAFFAQIANIWATTPWMFPFQALRAMLWTAFALPVIRMLKGQQWEVGLAIALLFAVWSSQLLLPNPYMPETVARAHLVETVSSDFIFGWLVGWLLSRHHSSLRDLFQWSERLNR